MPLDRSSGPFEIDLLGNTAGNQVQPLLLSTKGRYAWSEEPFRLAVRDGTIRLTSDLGPLLVGPARYDAAGGRPSRRGALLPTVG